MSGRIVAGLALTAWVVLGVALTAPWYIAFGVALFGAWWAIEYHLLELTHEMEALQAELAALDAES